MNTLPAVVRRAAFCGALLSSAPLWCLAQTAPAPTSAPNSAQASEVVQLSPFTVNSDEDKSWVATTTLAANRTNQEIAKVPATINAITSEFIKDLNLGTLEDAAAFVSGLSVQPRLESRNDDGRLSFRGLTAA